MNRFTMGLVAIALLNSCGGDSSSQEAVLGVATQDHPAFVPHRLLVKFKPGVAEEHAQRVLHEHGAKQTSSIPQIGVRILELPEQADERAQAKALSARPEVEFAEVDHVCEPALEANDPYYSRAWHLAKIGCPAAWDTTTGSSSITIAILDTGVYAGHEDLAPKMVPGWNAYDNNADPADV